MKILLLAGEESGLLYANRLKGLLAGHEVRGYADYGFRTADLAVMGFAAVVGRLPYFIGVKRTMERAIDEWRPDVVCTIDYPGMNLKLAAYAKARGVRTIHVVCPQVWAWKAGRIPKIEAALDRLCCFFPFEPALFRPGFATFVGHPLAEDFPTRPPVSPGRALRTVALLPGSRIGEIERCLPVMLESLSALPGVRGVVPAANAAAKEMIVSLVSAYKAEETGRNAEIEILDGGARELLLRADCAVVASGTATLEAALARCPTVLVYRVSAALAWFARRVIKGIRHIGLVNVVWEKGGGTGEEPMPELLQERFTAENVSAVLGRWLGSDEALESARARLDEVVRGLGTGAGAMSALVAEIVR